MLMILKLTVFRILLILFASVYIQPMKAQELDNIFVFDNAILVTGKNEPPIENAIFIVAGDRITAVGEKGTVDIPDAAVHIDLSGKTVIPALIDTHKHPSDQSDKLIEQLKELASYGVGTVLSLGLDNNDAVYRLRHELLPNASRYLTSGRGITTPEPGRSESAYGTAPAAYWINSIEEGRLAVREQADKGVDFIKIWVDDRGGRYEKMSPQMYTAIIDEAHKYGLPVAAHIHHLEDAKGLLRAGLDVFAHGVRDQDVDDELIELFQQHPEVYLVPNLPDEGVAIDIRGLHGLIPNEVIETVESEYAGTAADQAFYQIQARNLKALYDAGVKIAFGTDGREMWEVFIELENMVTSGMTPADVIIAATRTSAELLKLDDVGTMEAGKIADFIVLNDSPLEDIKNIRQIDSVYLRGTKLESTNK